MGKADLFFNLGIKVIQHAGEFVTDANSRERLARNFLAASRSLRDSGERGLEQVQLENLQQIALGDEIKLFAPEKINGQLVKLSLLVFPIDSNISYLKPSSFTSQVPQSSNELSSRLIAAMPGTTCKVFNEPRRAKSPAFHNVI